MKLTDAQKLEFLVDTLGDQMLEIYEAWIKWCEENDPSPLPSYYEFERTAYIEIDRQRFGRAAE